MNISRSRVGFESYDWWASKRSEANCRLVDDVRHGLGVPCESSLTLHGGFLNSQRRMASLMIESLCTIVPI